ncbi:MAG: RNA chaperone ProQ [Glaciecola sp. HTCC2999]|jgi:ProP effector|nr:MAG: RNA chaperone ProQ [Glaciecola sp. HTCC2999]
MENPQKITDSKAVIALLAELFPDCFSTKGPAKPLKIGVFQDLVTRLENDERVSKTTLRSTLRHYTNSWRYLEALKENARRVDLDGVEGDVIDKEHADFAASQLETSKAKVAASKKNTPKKKAATNKTFKNKPSVNKLTTQQAKKNAPKPVAVKLSETDLKAGTAVSVKVGKSPMPAVIKDIQKDGIQVQLNTGMVVKVSQDQLRLMNHGK